MAILYVGDMVSVRQDGVERVGRVVSFSSHRACQYVGVNLGQGPEWIRTGDVFAVVESVGPKAGAVVSDGSSFSKAGVTPPGERHLWTAGSPGGPAS